MKVVRGTLAVNCIICFTIAAVSIRRTVGSWRVSISSQVSGRRRTAKRGIEIADLCLMLRSNIAWDNKSVGHVVLTLQTTGTGTVNI